jgi:DNA (cytosine-5)-methyltransferase 1
MSLTFLDLFSGAGGLSLGFAQAGLRPVGAVEFSPMAAETYYYNFISRDQPSWEAHVRSGLAEQLQTGLAIASVPAILSELPIEAMFRDQVDILAGGPPCQGFSLAGRRVALDGRNRLPWDFLDFVEAIRPRAVVMENVSGIGYTFSAGSPSVLEDLTFALGQASPGYWTSVLELNAHDFGVPQHRPRVFLIGIRNDVARDLGFHEGDYPSGSRWRSATGSPNHPLSLPVRNTRAAVGSALGDLDRRGEYLYQSITDYGHGLAFAARLRFDQSLQPPTAGLPHPRPINHEVRAHGARISVRFALLLYASAHGIHPSVFRATGDEDADVGRVWDAVASAGPAVVTPTTLLDGTRVADPEELVCAIVRAQSRKHSQRVLIEREPAPTMLSLPDDHVHFREPRTLTVKEVARIQSFPDGFVFRAKVTTGGRQRRHDVPQYTQVGNAVPPLVAAALGCRLRELLN